MSEPLFKRVLQVFVLVLLGCGVSHAQLGAISGRAEGNISVGQPRGAVVLGPASYAQIRVCSTPTTGFPCATPAVVFDLTGNPLSVVGGNFGQVTADVTGFYNFQCTTALYQIQIQAATSNTPVQTFFASCPTVITGAISWSALQSATGNLTLNNSTFTTTFNQTTPTIWSWINTIAGANGAAQNSPIINLCGNGWNGAASYQNCGTMQMTLANNTTQLTDILTFAVAVGGQIQFNTPVAFNTNTVTMNAGTNIVWSGKSIIDSPGDGLIRLRNNAGNAFTRLQFGGITNSFPAFCTATTVITACLADGTTGATLAANLLQATTATIGGGSTLTLYKTVTDTPGAITVNSQTCTDRGVALAGSATTATITVAANYALDANIVIGPAQAVAGTVHYRICNTTGANITLNAAATFNLAVIQ